MALRRPRHAEERKKERKLDLRAAISVLLLKRIFYHFFSQKDNERMQEICDAFISLEMSSHAFFFSALVNVGLHLPLIICFLSSTNSASRLSPVRFSFRIHGGCHHIIKFRLYIRKSVNSTPVSDL